jgi:hypothetical protein
VSEDISTLIFLPPRRPLAQLGVNLSIVSRVIGVSTGAILDAILRLTGNV